MLYYTNLICGLSIIHMIASGVIFMIGIILRNDLFYNVGWMTLVTSFMTGVGEPLFKLHELDHAHKFGLRPRDSIDDWYRENWSN